MRRSRIVVGLLSIAGASAPLSAQEDFSGIRTFLKAQQATCLQPFAADIAVLGVPFDEGTSSRPVAQRSPTSAASELDVA